MTTHRHTLNRAKSPTYLSWKAMRDRCSRPTDAGFKNYGAKGVTVCPQWQESFEQFLKDVGLRPSTRHTLDRIKNELGYEPGNVRWATRAEQNRNRAGNVFLTFEGRTQVVADWAREIGVHATTLVSRMKAGLPVEQVLVKESRKSGPKPRRLLEHDGRSLTVAEWAKTLGLAEKTIETRLRAKWPVRRALTEQPRTLKT